MNLPSQDEILYNNRRWRPEVDAIIMDTVLDHFGGRTPLHNAILGDEVLRKISRNLKKAFGRFYAWELVDDRFRFLRKRFLAFKTLVETPNVSWDLGDNMIIVDDLTFRSIVQRNGLSQTYYRKADPDIDKLRLLFETEELKLTPFQVFPKHESGPDGCSTNPVIISEDEWEYEPKDDYETGSSDDGPSADGSH